MNRTVHDKETNTLHIIKSDKTVNGEISTVKESRAFILVTVDNQQQLEDFQKGNQNNIQLSPVLASSEEEAVKIVQEKGKIVLNVTNYEFLKLQVSLLEDLAASQNTKLIVLDLFKLEK